MGLIIAKQGVGVAGLVCDSEAHSENTVQHIARFLNDQVEGHPVVIAWVGEESVCTYIAQALLRKLTDIIAECVSTGINPHKLFQDDDKKIYNRFVQLTQEVVANLYREIRQEYQERDPDFKDDVPASFVLLFQGKLFHIEDSVGTKVNPIQDYLLLGEGASHALPVIKITNSAIYAAQMATTTCSACAGPVHDFFSHENHDGWLLKYTLYETADPVK